MKRIGLSAYLMPRKRSWLNSGRERPTKIVFGLSLLVDRVAVGGFAVVPVVLDERGLAIAPHIIEKNEVERSMEVLVIDRIFEVLELKLGESKDSG